ncbi:penicillin-binding transpeptidase domain-containing protein [Corynebacterium epidermidicanis]|uniref:Cell division protein FtsI/penicillin-binding protein 2 n=1 Tax=Corynebacterium epidermidicanis TaxID=1050174 RepID=A0A0G3GX17_9CORY|nr:penicillin-binding transpeptidase domain-containing protein [Corynebacterium epidermidicanis]AKK03397.1 cell division protein FtsI/penicillin-binding protein 2 [Corynebacterium epidermidicanis]
MRRITGFLATVGFVAATVTACTPKPDVADPVIREFLQALEQGDVEKAAQLTDNPDATRTAVQESIDGMQAEGLRAELLRVDNQDTLATATYRLDWRLPRERNFDYEAQVAATKIKDQWKVRYAPAMVHPQLGAHQHLELRAIPAQKSRVISADGADVLAPGSVYRILINPAEAGNTSGVAARVAMALGQAHERDAAVPVIDQQALAKELAGRTGNYSVTVVSGPNGKIVADELRGVPGVIVNEEAAMVRTDPTFAPEIMSRVEKIVRDDLDGANGWQIAKVNNNGAEMASLYRKEPELRPAVQVSLDHQMQNAAQQAVDLRKEMKAMMVAIRPSTGEILAVAQTKRADEDGDPALMGQYPPGSTFKMITAAAGLAHQGLNTGSTVPCPGTMEVGPRIVTNYNSFSRGNTSLDDAFAQSCNTTFADISARLAPGQLQDMAKSFGLGVDYAIPGLDTMTGQVPHGDEFMERVDEGYGQGRDLASPFGLALVAATAAAGKTPTPVLVSGHPGTADQHVSPPPAEVVNQLRTMMRSVVTSGTARGMRQKGGAVSGKTGEAEFSGGSHAWFAGFREDDIAFATLIVGGGGSESAVAITDYFFVQLDAARHPEASEAG